MSADAPVYGIILGAAVKPGAEPSDALRRRILHGAALFHAGEVERLICSGGIGKMPPSEASVMRRVLIENGVPDGVITLEDGSHSTLENLTLSRAILPKGATVCVISEKYHLPRAVLCARRLGLHARGSGPSIKDTSPARLAFACLREIPALALYALRPMPRAANLGE